MAKTLLATPITIATVARNYNGGCLFTPIALVWARGVGIVNDAALALNNPFDKILSVKSKTVVQDVEEAGLTAAVGARLGPADGDEGCTEGPRSFAEQLLNSLCIFLWSRNSSLSLLRLAILFNPDVEFFLSDRPVRFHDAFKDIWLHKG